MEINGWQLFQHKLFRIRFEHLFAESQRLKRDQPTAYKNHRTVKLLTRVIDLITNEIPADPSHERFNQGNTLGEQFRFWKRAKFGRYRLFFRYDSSSKVIIYAWMNDETTLRKEGDKNDPYAIFARGLSRGEPPSTIEALLKGSEEFNLSPNQ